MNAILNTGLGCRIKFWKDTIQWPSQGQKTYGQRTKSSAYSQTKLIIISVFWTKWTQKQNSIVNVICWLMPSSGTIQLSTVKWFNKYDTIVLEVNNCRNKAHIHVHVLSVCRTENHASS